MIKKPAVFISLLSICAITPASFAAQTTTHACVADTYVQANKTADNFGGESNLTLRNSSSGFSRIPYLKFDVSGLLGNVTSVKLKLHSNNSAAPIKAYAIGDNSWTETGITWNTRPAFGSEIGTGTAVAGNWFEIDITGYMTADGTYSIALDEQDNAVTKLDSKEADFTSYLEVTTDYVPPPPSFNTDPISDSAKLYIEYKDSLAGTATDPNGDTLTYSKISGPEWLAVRVNGDIVGTPDTLGANSFTIKAENTSGAFDTATLEIDVASVTPEIVVTDRAGSNVTAEVNTAINSDHIRIEAIASVSLTQGSFSYKYLEQASEPNAGQWNAEPAQEFWHDIWFYRKPSNQWVKIDVTDIDNNTVSAVYGLQGGTLTAPPDEPFTNVEYVDAMGPGLIVEADSDKDPIPEVDTIQIKKAGFGHIRMHIGRLLSDKLTPNTPANNPNYYQLLDRWIEQISRHGMYCHIGNKGNSVYEDAVPKNPDNDTQAWRDAYAAEHFDWWTNVLDHCKYKSHRLAYHMFLETGGNSFMGSAPDLDAFHSNVTKQVRLVDPGRMLIYPPPSLNNVFRLTEMSFPYGDHDAGDGIDTSSGDYWFSDFHKSFAGGRGYFLEADKQIVRDNLTAAQAWVASNNVPLIMSAVRPTDSNSRHDEYIQNRVRYVEDLYDMCDSAELPIRITWLSFNNYNFTKGAGWRPGMRTVLEAMNRQGTADGTDPDGDQISTADEINIYGTNPYLSDTDGDNILDTYECTMDIFDPLDPADGDPMDDLSIRADFDGDGMDNAWEMLNAVKWGDDTLTSPHRFDPTDPSDALVDEENDGIVNIWERILRINPLDDISVKGDDATTDWDKDGVTNIVEIAAQTWPMGTSSTEFDADYDTIGSDIDTVPYIHDNGYIAGYTYDSGATDISSQGANNAGILMNGSSVSNGIAALDGTNDFIDIPTTDFGSTSNRSVNLHFWAAQPGGTQVLYKEGGADSGMSIYLDGSKLWMGVWNQPQEQFVEMGTVNPQQWYSITATFGAGSLSGYKFHGNTRQVSTNVSTTVATLGDVAFRTALGGSDDATRVWSGSGSTTATGAYFSGYLDDSHIYNRVLSEGDASLLARNDIYPARQPTLPATLPYFLSDPVVEIDAIVGEVYGTTLADNATDPNSDPLTFSKISGPAWLSVAANGALSGTPAVSNAGSNSFTVEVTDSVHGTNSAVLEIDVMNLSAAVSYTATEDTYVDENNAGTIRGGDNRIRLKSLSAGASRIGYVKFSVSGLIDPVGKAILKLYSNDLAATVKAYALDNVWNENTTWNIKPPSLITEIGSGTATAGAWFEIDITDYITGNGTFSIALDEKSASVADVSSTEGANPPVLEIRTAVPVSAYAEWWNANGLTETNSAYLVDADDDGLNNLMEYALGGNPATGAEVPSITPTSEMVDVGGSNVVEYVYRRRTDAVVRGLDYTLEVATNLLAGSWSTNVHTEVNTASLEPGFEAVTNHVDTAPDSRFIRLKIEFNE